MLEKFTLKESITFALLQLMDIKPYENITVTDIVKRSGVCRASFYRNYRDKQQILENYIKFALCDCPDYSKSEYSQDIEKQIYSVYASIKENRLLFDMLKKNNLLHLLSNQINQMTEDYIHSNNIHMSHYEVAFYSYSALGMIVEWIKNNYKETEKDMTEIYMKFVNLK